MSLKDVNCIMIDHGGGTVTLSRIGEYNEEKEEWHQDLIATFNMVEDPDENLSWSERLAESFHVEFEEVT